VRKSLANKAGRKAMKKSKSSITVTVIEHHRNGISGEPFNVVLFRDNDMEANMVAIVFEAPGYVAVLDADQTAAGNVAFASNSWRGDWYAGDLREAIKKWEADEEAKFPEKVEAFAAKMEALNQKFGKS
jgi:hypothetical protein